MARKIIGVCGFIGSGKSTVAEILVTEFGFKRLSFADRLKDSVSAIFDLPRDMLEGNTEKSRVWREQPLEFWTRELGWEVTPRSMLQLTGTDCMRNGFDQNIWTLIVKQQLLNDFEQNYVVPDARFLNEKQMIKAVGGEVWQVRRGTDPEWVPSAISDNRYSTNWMDDYPEVHESEWRWLDLNETFDATIYNNTTREDLENTVRTLISAN